MNLVFSFLLKAEMREEVVVISVGGAKSCRCDVAHRENDWRRCDLIKGCMFQHPVKSGVLWLKGRMDFSVFCCPPVVFTARFEAQIIV